MSAFTDNELKYLTERRPDRLARIATVGKDGTPHVVPVGMWTYNAEDETIEVGGHDLGRSKKFKDARRNGRAAIVIDDLLSTDPWRPRGVEIRGRAEAVDGNQAMIRIHPERIVSWGIESDVIGERHSRAVTDPTRA
jgi:pyridoxamine 5'-phosphate oxidase family protein